MTVKPSFLNHPSPLNTCMVQVGNASDAMIHARNAAFDGCDAYGFQMECFNPAERDEKTLKSIFALMDNKPIYATNYRKHLNGDASDEELSEGLMHLRKCGATLLDVMGDYYKPTKYEITYDDDAVSKQKKLIDRIHEAGGEVLMSSHVVEFRPLEEVMKIALAHEKRGADITKIVTAANSEEEEMENLRIVSVLKKELKIPFLFLAGGTHNKLLRTIGPALGSCMWLTVWAHHPLSTKQQPLCRAMTQLKMSLCL